MTNPVQTVFEKMKQEAQKVIVGQTELFELIVVSLFSGGHVLLEGVPGTAKTLVAKTLAMIVSGQFSRVQFTPDLMPSDIVGTSVYDLTTNQFNLKHGPVFTNVLLADEINRAPAKTQSALLECMEERQVSIDGVRHELPPAIHGISNAKPHRIRRHLSTSRSAARSISVQIACGLSCSRSGNRDFDELSSRF